MFVVMDIKAAGWQCSGAGAARRSEKKARSGEEDRAFWPASDAYASATSHHRQRRTTWGFPTTELQALLPPPRLRADSTGAESKRSSSLRVDIN